MQLKKQNSIDGEWIKNEEEYAIALTYSEKKIEEFKRKDMTNLVELMAKWRLLLGVTSESSDQELIVICQFMYDNFKKYTLSDVNLAMNWAISGKIDVGFVTQKNISSFYVSKAMKAYDETKRGIVNRIMVEREKHLERLQNKNKPILSEIEKANSFKELIVGMYDSVQNGGFFYDIGDMVYNWIKRTGQMSPSKKEIDLAIRYGQDKYFKELEDKSIRQKIMNSFNPIDKERLQKKYAREYMVLEYFKAHQMIEIIKKIHPSQFSIETNK